MNSKRLKCDGERIHQEDKNAVPCIGIASFWNPETGLCYCDRHRHRLIRLRHISEMSEEQMASALERQKKEGIGR